MFGLLHIFFQLAVFGSLGNVESRPDLLAELKWRRKEEYGTEWVKRGREITGDWEGRDEEKEVDRYSPHARSPATFQRWLRL